MQTELNDQRQYSMRLKRWAFKLVVGACGVAMGVAFTLEVAMTADSTATPAQVASPVQTVSPIRAAPPPQVAPLADKLLGQTCEVLGSADAFSFHAEVLFDQVLPSAVKVQFSGEINFALQRPDELAIEYQSDLGGKQLWYQKNTLTVFDRPYLMYATLQVPDSIDQMLDRVAEIHNLRLPLSNLAYSDPCLRIRKQIIFGTYVGVNDVNGVDCDHLAFSSSKIDFQVWLDRSAKPVPRKIVINYRTEPGSPEYIAVLSAWKFPKQIPLAHFRYRLPKDAQRIEFLKVKEPQP
jgi:hypothetical protein